MTSGMVRGRGAAQGEIQHGGILGQLSDSGPFFWADLNLRPGGRISVCVGGTSREMPEESSKEKPCLSQCPSVSRSHALTGTESAETEMSVQWGQQRKTKAQGC